MSNLICKEKNKNNFNNRLEIRNNKIIKSQKYIMLNKEYSNLKINITKNMFDILLSKKVNKYVFWINFSFTKLEALQIECLKYSKNKK